MCHGPILGKMLLFAVTILVSGFLNQLFHMADMAIAGQFIGDSALAAVGSSGSLISLLTQLFAGLSIGTNVLAARYFGAKQEEQLRSTIHTSVLVGVCGGVILMAVGTLSAGQLLIWMDTPKEILGSAVLYLQIYFLAMPATLMNQFISGILLGIGDPTRSLRYSSLVGVINVFLNILFVTVFRMGIAGIAGATVISAYVSMFLGVGYLCKKEGTLRLEIRKLRVDPKILGMILRLGLPSSLRGIIFSFTNVVVQTAINSFGEVIVAGDVAAANITNIVHMAMNSFYRAAIAFTSQNVGAEKHDRINRIAFTSVACAAVTGLITGGLATIFGRPLLGIYTSSPEVIEAGMIRLYVVATLYWMCGMMETIEGVLRGMGYAIVPTIVSLVGGSAVPLLFIGTVFQVEKLHTITFLYLNYPITWVLTTSVHVICFLTIQRKNRISREKSRKNTKKI